MDDIDREHDLSHLSDAEYREAIRHIEQLVGSSTWRQRRGDVLAFLFGGHMADLVDRNRVIEILEQMRDRRKGSCSRQAMIEATAMQYAIEVVKKVPREAEQTDKD